MTVDEGLLFEGPSPLCAAYSSAVRLQYDRVKGRMLIATKKIPAGALLVAEQAYAAVMPTWTTTARTSTMLCHTCFERLPAEPLHCPKCPDSKHVQFCSRQCRLEALKTYHRYQCGSEKINGTHKGELIFAMICRILSCASPQQLVDADVQKTHNVDETLKGDYTTVFSLVGHADHINDHLLPLLAEAIAKHMQLRGYFDSGEWVETGLSPDQRFDLVRRHAVLLIPKYRSNNFSAHMHCLLNDFEDLLTFDLDDKPRMLYACASFVNHSCWRNVTHYFHGRNIRMRAIRPIDKGEEITTNYGAIFGLQQNLKRRREWLERSFKFFCQCVACASHGEFANMERLLRAVQCQHCVGGAAINESELEQYQSTFARVLHDNRCERLA